MDPPSLNSGASPPPAKIRWARQLETVALRNLVLPTARARALVTSHPPSQPRHWEDAAQGVSAQAAMLCDVWFEMRTRSAQGPPDMTSQVAIQTLNPSWHLNLLELPFTFNAHSPFFHLRVLAKASEPPDAFSSNHSHTLSRNPSRSSSQVFREILGPASAGPDIVLERWIDLNYVQNLGPSFPSGPLPSNAVLLFLDGMYMTPVNYGSSDLPPDPRLPVDGPPLPGISGLPQQRLAATTNGQDLTRSSSSVNSLATTGLSVPAIVRDSPRSSQEPADDANDAREKLCTQTLPGSSQDLTPATGSILAASSTPSAPLAPLSSDTPRTPRTAPSEEALMDHESLPFSPYPFMTLHTHKVPAHRVKLSYDRDKLSRILVLQKQTFAERLRLKDRLAAQEAVLQREEDRLLGVRELQNMRRRLNRLETEVLCQTQEIEADRLKIKDSLLTVSNRHALLEASETRVLELQTNVKEAAQDLAVFRDAAAQLDLAKRSKQRDMVAVLETIFPLDKHFVPYHNQHDQMPRTASPMPHQGRMNAIPLMPTYSAPNGGNSPSHSHSDALGQVRSSALSPGHSGAPVSARSNSGMAGTPNSVSGQSRLSQAPMRPPLPITLPGHMGPRHRSKPPPPHTLRGHVLPNSVFTSVDVEMVANLLGWLAHYLVMLSYYLQIPLRYPIKAMGSRSLIVDWLDSRFNPSPFFGAGLLKGPPSSSAFRLSRLGGSFYSAAVPLNRPGTLRSTGFNPFATSQGAAPLVAGSQTLDEPNAGSLVLCVTTVPTPHNQFPLFAKGSDQFKFEYAVFLMNKNLEGLAYELGQTTIHLRNTLPNLAALLQVIRSWPTVSAPSFTMALTHQLSARGGTSSKDDGDEATQRPSPVHIGESRGHSTDCEDLRVGTEVGARPGNELGSGFGSRLSKDHGQSAPPKSIAIVARGSTLQSPLAGSWGPSGIPPPVSATVQVGESVEEWRMREIEPAPEGSLGDSVPADVTEERPMPSFRFLRSLSGRHIPPKLADGPTTDPAGQTTGSDPTASAPGPPSGSPWTSWPLAARPLTHPASSRTPAHRRVSGASMTATPNPGIHSHTEDAAAGNGLGKRKLSLSGASLSSTSTSSSLSWWKGGSLWGGLLSSVSAPTSSGGVAPGKEEPNPGSELTNLGNSDS